MKKSLLLLILCLFLAGCGKVQGPGVGNPSHNTGSVSTSCNAGHVDLANDGFCDNCSKLLLVTIDFYAMNDLHGKIDDGDGHPGVDELSTYLKNAQKEDDHSILLSAGDMWQGSSESNLTQGILATDWMNQMAFAAMVLGNHEFDWGETSIEKNQEFADFPLLAINVYDKETNKQVDYCDSSVVINKGDVQIGIIGAIGDVYSSIASEKTQNVFFKTGKDLTNLVKAEATRLRDQGVDFIVYLLHDGYGSSKSDKVATVSSLGSYYDTSLSMGYVDLVFEGHTHQKYIIKDKQGVYHLQHKGDNKGGISHVEITLNSANGKYTVNTAELVSTGAYENLPDDPIVDHLLEKYKDQIGFANDVLGQNARRRNSTEMMQIVADLYYQTGVEKWGNQYPIVLGGGFLSVRSPYNLEAGDVTYAQLQSLFPFDNQLVLCSIQGKYLKSRFFENGDDRYAIGYGDYGGNVKNNIDPDKTYYIVVDSYSSTYAPNQLTEIARYDSNIFARDLLAEYAKRGGFQ